ncbi:MAG: DUF1553 domain-containing protein [Verrucomicrobiales bacterium]|nr:DUF1553 domain-containing protein [Verrucomicrobiales bacterium]
MNRVCSYCLLFLFGVSGYADDGEKWWSFVPPTKPEIPADENAIDFLLEKRLAEQGLDLSPEAEKRTLIRRVFLVMLGMPPTAGELARFEKADYAELVDFVLADSRYGERWAQHWLDVIRWAETVGFETNLERKNAWPYRDWVISALNSDLPYDQFIFEQLAGDTTGNDAALGFLVAGPANLPGQIGRDEEAMRQARQDELDEVIRTVGQSLFGLTIGCARCHDHKFDPISERDYYAMQAVFAGLTYGDRRWRGKENDEWTTRVPEVRQKLDTLKKESEKLRVGLMLHRPLDDVHTDEFEPVTARAVRMKIHATNNGGAATLYELEVWSGEKNVALASVGSRPSASSFALANQTRHFDNLVDGTVDKRQAFPWVSAKSGPAWVQVDFAGPETIDRVTWHRAGGYPADYDLEFLPSGPDDWQPLANSRKRMLRVDDTRDVKTVRLTGLTPEKIQQVADQVAKIRKAEAELARLSRGPQVYGAIFTDEPEETFVLSRGDPMNRAGRIDPAIPVSLGKLKLDPKSAEPNRRLALAKHLTDPAHPLTARVIVNRIWQHHFGTGLVETSSDFGKMGIPPSHPKLLDWLAIEFVENGWSLKSLHRNILHSRAFRQSSLPNQKAATIDAEARLLWRFPPRRMEAESIRDSILAVSGKLNRKAGGRGFDFFQQRGGLSDYRAKETFDADGWRRMIYAHKIRMQAVDIFGAFDCPDAGQMKPNRTRSITPIQSLSLMNSPFSNRQAAFFAERIRAEAGTEPPSQIDRAFLLAYSREPDLDERERLINLAAGHGLDQVCRVIFNTSEFVFLQ